MPGDPFAFFFAIHSVQRSLASRECGYFKATANAAAAIVGQIGSFPCLSSSE